MTPIRNKPLFFSLVALMVISVATALFFLWTL